VQPLLLETGRLGPHSPGQSERAVFAAYLNTSRSTVQKWEQGQKKPNGPSLKLLNLIEQKGLEALG
jgi:putative transcriptional regulator